MVQKIFTGSEAMILKVSVSTLVSTELRLMVEDASQENTVLTDRVREVTGDFDFYVRLPLTRKYVNLYLVNNADGSDNGFVYKGFVKMPLERRLKEIDFTKYHLREYITFIQKFCYNAGVLPVNDPKNDRAYYISDGQHFLIKYLPTIVDYETNQELTTPARVGDDGLIEVSQKYYMGYSVPKRIAILLHVYSHPYANENPDSEIEADLNGLTIYLGLGYPRIDGAEAWCDVFDNSDTDENFERLKIIDAFINDFENKKMVVWN